MAHKFHDTRNRSLLWRSRAIEPYSCGPDQILHVHPDRITMRSMSIRRMRGWQSQMSRAKWNNSGRGMSFGAYHEDTLIGLVHFTSPVIILGVRDAFLELPSDGTERGKALRNYVDVSVCVGAQPLAWYWNIGKLLALMAPTVSDAYTAKYGDELLGLTTTSLWGKGSQYNRVWKFLGYTKGYGHEHVSHSEYRMMFDTLQEMGELPTCSTNQQMAVLERYKRLVDPESPGAYHGNKRGVFYHDPLPEADRQDQIDHWYERWGKSRWERKRDEDPPYTDGITKADE